MKIKDKELLKIYMQGFSDELDEKPPTLYNEEIKNRAYSIGVNHAILGDTVRSVDYLTNEEVLDIILRKKE